MEYLFLHSHKTKRLVCNINNSKAKFHQLMVKVSQELYWLLVMLLMGGKNPTKTDELISEKKPC